jgi:uncharacterized integral membrane protein (TIGR00697 family)
MPQLSENALMKVLIALAVYVVSLIGSNTLGIKLVPVPFTDLHLSAAFFMFPVVFIMTDIIGEVYGKKMAKWFVYCGILVNLLFIAYNVIASLLPWSPDGAWAQSAFDTVFSVSLRFAIASVVAYAVGEYQDVLAFFFAKGKFEKAGFWVRSNFSNLWSQLFDSALFLGIAFYGNPHYPLPVLAKLIISWWLFKVVIGFVFTPLSYLGIWLIKDRNAHTAPQNTAV